MQKNIVLAVFAVIILGLFGYIMFNGDTAKSLSSAEAKSVAEKFINENLLQPGVTANISDVVKANGMYKLSLTLPDGSQVDTYLTKDGELFFPEAMNIAEITAQIAANSSANQNSNMQVQMETITEGSGDQVVEAGNNITVDYTGTLEDGTEFDSSIGKEPFTFTIGQGAVIQGWDQGLLGMKVGEERKLIIPSDLGYGPSGNGPIPPNATLIFTVKLVSINS